MIQKINAVNSMNPGQRIDFKGDDGIYTELGFTTPPYDLYEFTTPQAPPKIGFFRLAFNRLTDEQIAAVNESGKLPGNAKFYPGITNGKYSIGNKILGITQGTTTLPAGTEVRKSWLGFTKVVNKDTEGWFLRGK